LRESEDRSFLLPSSFFGLGSKIMSNTENILKTDGLGIGYAGKESLAQSLNLSLRAGELVGLLGPNGAGKSTLIRTLSGLQKPVSGHTLIDGRDVHKIQPKEKAKLLSLVLTEPVVVGNLTVQQLVSLGRHPYSNWLGQLDKQDEETVNWALETTGIRDFAHRSIHTLSDGEGQKALIARALAQDTALMILDEPTSHLDIPNRISVIRLLRKLVVETGKTIVFSTHELDLALQVADRLWLMHEQQIDTGVPEDLVLAGTFSQTFYKDDITFDEHTGTFKVHESAHKFINLMGEGSAFFWTKRALEREGFSVGESSISVIVEKRNNKANWKIQKGNREEMCLSIAELLWQLKNFAPQPHEKGRGVEI